MRSPQDIKNSIESLRDTLDLNNTSISALVGLALEAVDNYGTSLEWYDQADIMLTELQNKLSS